MKTVPADDYVELTERFFTVVKSLNDFDKTEVRTIINSLIGNKTDEETFISVCTIVLRRT